MRFVCLVLLSGCTSLLGLFAKDQDTDTDDRSPPTVDTTPGDDDDDDDDDDTLTTTSTTTSTTTTTTSTTVVVPPPRATVYDLQAGAVPLLGEVEVRDLVITGVADFGFFAQERQGGQGSGIWIFAGPGWENRWSVGPADRVTLVGLYDEFLGLSQLDVTGASGDVAFLGVGVMPTPARVTYADLQPANAEPWESVLVVVTGGRIANPNSGNGEFVVSDAAGSIAIDDQMHLWSDYDALPAGATMVEVVGVLNYSANAFKLEPRSDNDVVTAAVSPYDIQQGLVSIGADIEAYGLVVSAVGTDGLFVQHENGGPYSGLWVYLGTNYEARWGTFLAGDRIDLWGRYEEYFDLTEINVTTAGAPYVAVRSSGAAPTPAVIAVADAGEPYEGVLVEVRNVEVADPDIGFGEWLVRPLVGNDTIAIDDKFHVYVDRNTLAVNDRFDRIAGPLTYAFSAFKIEPRGAFDIVPR